MKNEEKVDKVIDMVATIAIITFFVGAMVAIWIGLVGVKILLSAVVLFAGDCATYFWTKTVFPIYFRKKNREKKMQKGGGRL